MKPTYTEKQGRYLAFIQAYTVLNGRPPAVNDIARFFDVRPPSAQGMVQQLEKKGLITKTPGAARTIRVTLAPSDLPCLVCAGDSIKTPVEGY